MAGVRIRPTRATTFLSILLLLAAAFIFFSPSATGSTIEPRAQSTHSKVLHIPTAHKQLLAYFSHEASSSQLEYGKDGLVRGWDKLHQQIKQGATVLKKKEKKRLEDSGRRHPIEELMEKGQRKWQDQLKRQSRTLPQAVMEYTRRYGRAPPRGFEAWWKFAKRSNMRIVDDYDQIFRDIEPYFALSPEMFRDRCDALNDTVHTYHITLSPTGESRLYGDRAHSARPRLFFSLIQPLAPLLPREVTIHGSDHDLGSWLLGDDVKQAALQAIREGRYLSTEELKDLEKKDRGLEVKGTVSACPKGSAAWNRALVLQRGGQVADTQHETTFIHDPLPTYDFCTNPSLLTLHGSLSFDFPRDNALRPIFQWSKNSRNPEFLATPLEAYENATSGSALAKYTPWEEKSINKVFWRGSSTGDSYSRRKGYDWRRSHRPRLHLLAQASRGQKGVWVQRDTGNGRGTGKGNEWVWEMWGNKELNERYLDVGLTGGPHQCKQEDGTCDEMAQEIHFLDRVRPEESAKYKYALDIDGNGWSSRFHRLMLSGSVVLKSTIYPEWMSDWLTPWVHYVPIQIDNSDIYSILSFFIGPPDSTPDDRTSGKGVKSNRSNKRQGSQGGHDDLARQIAEQGRAFAQEFWRWEDMQGYMLRMLLEYTRLQADDREAWSYQKTYDVRGGSGGIEGRRVRRGSPLTSGHKMAPDGQDRG